MRAVPSIDIADASPEPAVVERAREPVARSRPSPLAPARDAALATVALVAAIAAGSRGFRDVDPALLGYLGATLVSTFATSWRASAFWRRPASAFYGRALLGSLGEPRRLRRTIAAAGRDLAAQSFIRRRSAVRWAAHLLLSFGTLASFAITLPLVFGWMHFRAEGDRSYQIALFGVPTIRFAVDGIFGWFLFHALSLAGGAVLLGATAFLVARLRARRHPGATSSFAVAPLVLLVVVALTGLALPASRNWSALFPVAARLHEASVVALLIALPFSKLGHVLIRPLQLGARAVKQADGDWARCVSCGAPLAPPAQQRAVADLLARRGIRLGSRADHCPSCRRRQVASAQADLVGAHFQPHVLGARPGAREVG